MASSSSAVKDSVILTEDDIAGASLAGRNPSSLKNEELRFWLRCRGDSLKGLLRPLRTFKSFKGIPTTPQCIVRTVLQAKILF